MENVFKCFEIANDNAEHNGYTGKHVTAFTLRELGGRQRGASLYSLGCLCLKIINGPRRLFLMEEREENELCHLLMGDLRDERQKAGKQITSQKALVLFAKKNNIFFFFSFSISANTNVCWNIFNGSKIEMLLDRSVSYY